MIYFDYNATTPILPEVTDSMLPYLSNEWGNPSSSYRFGSKLKSVIERARQQVAELIGAGSREILFTGGGTESNNTALHSAVMSQPQRRHIVTSQVEHSSVLTACNYLERYHGCRVTKLPVDRDGLLSVTDLENALTDDTAVVSLMWANNETGVVFPVHEISELCRNRGVLFHCDAVQAVAKVPIDLRKLACDYLSLTGHKLGGPKGVGAIYVNRKAPFIPLLHGGHQERSRRGGTENVAAVVGFGAASKAAIRSLPTYERAVRKLRDELETGILAGVAGAEVNGDASRRLVNTSNIHFPGVESEALLLLLDQAGICASSGSACLADSPEPSHVIAAMKDGAVARQSVRLSLGMGISDDDLKSAIHGIVTAVESLKFSSRNRSDA